MWLLKAHSKGREEKILSNSRDFTGSHKTVLAPFFTLATIICQMLLYIM